MEPEDNRRFSQSPNMTMKLFSANTSENFHSVQRVQTTNCRRRKRTIMAYSTDEHHQCSFTTPSVCSRSILSSSPLVLFLVSTLLLVTCIPPSHSLPFGSLSSDSGSHRSQVDLLIDPIHQAEYGDYDPLENTRVVKSVFDMVLRTPPPPTSSSSRCPPGTQSPFDGGPCIKKSTDPVALVDQSFLLDTLRGLAKKGDLLGGPQKPRRPGSSGNNRRRPSGRPGSRTTSTTTSPPSTTMGSTEEELEGETLPTSTLSSGSTATGDIINENVAEEERLTVTQEPSTSSPLEATLPTTSQDNTEPAMPIEGMSLPSDQMVHDTITSQEATESSGTTIPTTEEITPTTAAPTTLETSTETSVETEGADLKRTASSETEPEALVPLPPTENEKQIIMVSSSAIAVAESTAETTSQTEVKSGKAYKGNEEPVQHPMLITTDSTTKAVPTPTNQLVNSSVANNQSSDGTSNDKVVFVDDIAHTNSQHEDQISPESSSEHIHPQDDQSNMHQIIKILSPSTTPTSSFAITPSSTSPAFLREEISSTLLDAVVVDKENYEKDIVAVAVTSTTSPSSSSPTEMTSTVNPSTPSGMVARVLTGVNSAEDHPHHQFDKLNAQHQPKNIDDISVAKSLEMKTEEGVHEDILPKMPMTAIPTGILERDTDISETLPQDEAREDKQIHRDEIKIVSVTAMPSASSEMIETTSIPTASEMAFERVSEVNVIAASTQAPRFPAEEEESKKLTDPAVVREEEASATITTEKVSNIIPLGPVEKSQAVPETTSTTVVQEQVPQAQDLQGAGDISTTSKTTERDEMLRVNQAGEQGDDQPSFDKQAAVNHRMKDGTPTHEKETVTLELKDVDLPITSANLPSLVSLVHDDGKQEEMPTAMKDADVVQIKNSGEMLSSGSREQEAFPFEDGSRDQHVVADEPALETTLVPPPAPSTTGSPGSQNFQHFQPGGTLLQFQLPIVTRLPNSGNGQRQENDAVESFQSFPQFSTDANTGKVRFPNSAEDYTKPESSRGTLKPIFVQDFDVEYAPKQKPQHVVPPPQEWQVPQPFDALEVSNNTPQQRSPPSLPFQEYYDVGSAEYLQSEIDRQHQKSRSRNRLNNLQEPAVPSTTGQSLLPPELTYYSPQHQQHHQSSPSPQDQAHHSQQQPLYFARRNPSTDSLPYGYLNFRQGHDRFYHNNRRLIW